MRAFPERDDCAYVSARRGGHGFAHCIRVRMRSLASAPPCMLALDTETPAALSHTAASHRPPIDSALSCLPPPRTQDARLDPGPHTLARSPRPWATHLGNRGEAHGGRTFRAGSRLLPVGGALEWMTRATRRLLVELTTKDKLTSAPSELTTRAHPPHTARSARCPAPGRELLDETLNHKP